MIRTFAFAGVAALLVAACASVPTVPAALDLRQAVIVAVPSEPAVMLEESGWKGRSAVTGGMAGMGVGLTLGGLACMGTGFLAPLCLGTVVPLTTAVGTVGGAAIGAAHDRAAPGVAEKAKLLQAEWAEAVTRVPLAGQLQRQVRERASADVPLASDPAPAEPALWQLRSKLGVLGTAGSGADVPYVLQATGRLTVQRTGEKRYQFEKAYLVESPRRMTTAQWSADGALALRGAMDDLLTSLAASMAADLAAKRP